MCHGVVASLVVFFFFFQAEDGIRDLVRSRGLGDVYKRQLVLDRVRGGQHVEGSRQHERVPLDGDLPLLHRLLSLIHI